MLQHDLTQATLVIHSQWQVDMTLETYNSLCGATKTPSALMKIHVHMIRRSRTLETTEETKALTAVYDAFFADDRINSASECVLCETGSSKDSVPECTCGLDVKTTGMRWSVALPEAIKNATFTLQDTVHTNVTEPTSVSMTTSLGCLALVASRSTVENLERGRETLVLAVENVHGYFRGKDAKFPMLRKNLGYSVADEEKTYVFGKEVRELSLTQQDEVKSVFPTHLVLIDSSTVQTLIDQLFHMPKIVEICYMSVPSFKRFRLITHHYRAPARDELPPEFPCQAS